MPEVRRCKKAVAAVGKPVVLIVKQDMPEEIKCRNGLLGGNMMTALRSAGCVGVISDGPSRDVDEIRPLQMQYVLSGVTAGHGKWAVQSVNTGVEVFGMQVSPGEIIHMDENGAVKFPASVIDQVIEKAEYLQEFEENRQRRMRETEDVDELIKIMSGFYDWIYEKSCIYDIPTKVYFGKGQLQQLHTVMKEFGERVLLVYGGGSIRRNGIYDEAVTELHTAGKKYVELFGVEPNPSLTTVEKGVALCRRENVDVIVAIGGGSVIDCAKVVTAAVCSTLSPWELVLHPQEIKKAIPVIAVLTIAATGRRWIRLLLSRIRMDKEKIGTRNPPFAPRAAILDPTFTFSVNRYQSACGVADIMSHTMESYFAREDAGLQNRFAEGILKICTAYGPLVLKEPDNYEARANLMWAASWAINDMLKLGHMTQWSVHLMEHPLSAFYSVTHGEGLAVLTPHWMEYVLSEDTVDMFERFAREIWQVTEKDPWIAAREELNVHEDFFINSCICAHP